MLQRVRRGFFVCLFVFFFVFVFVFFFVFVFVFVCCFFFYSCLLVLTFLTGGNWQKWKRVFLTCPCHEIYRDEAVGLKSCKNTWKITIFVKMWIWGNIVKMRYFVNNCLIKAWILKKFFCTRVTHIIMIIWSTAHFVSTLSIFSYI